MRGRECKQCECYSGERKPKPPLREQEEEDIRENEKKFQTYRKRTLHREVECLQRKPVRSNSKIPERNLIEELSPHLPEILCIGREIVRNSKEVLREIAIIS